MGPILDSVGSTWGSTPASRNAREVTSPTEATKTPFFNRFRNASVLPSSSTARREKEPASLVNVMASISLLRIF